jgi:thiaminase
LRFLLAAAGLSAILDIEMNLHVKLCAGWGLSPSDLEQTPPAVEMLAYTRYVLDAGMRGDLLALKVALAPCVIGYAEIATRLASRPDAHAATNPYRVWIAEYAGAPYQEVAAKARAHLEDLAVREQAKDDLLFALMDAHARGLPAPRSIRRRLSSSGVQKVRANAATSPSPSA